MSNVSFLLAMSHEVIREESERMVVRLTGEDRDPTDDARLVMEAMGVPGERIDRHVQWLRDCAREEAHRIIAERYPDPGPEPLMPGWTCPDCTGSGIAPYGYCKRCDGTGGLDEPAVTLCVLEPMPSLGAMVR